MLPIVYHPNYVTPLPPEHRFPMPKFGVIYNLLLKEGLVTPDQFHQPQIATRNQLSQVHTKDYIEAFCSGTLDAKAMRRIGLPWSPVLVKRTRTAVGGTILTAQLALQHGLACNTAGGTHHAFTNFGSGFCIFNDLAVSARIIQQMGLAKKVLIVDLDVHQGDGTAAIFKDDPTVFTFSMHCQKNFPFRKQKSDLDIPLPEGMSDNDYLHMLAEHLPAVLVNFKPDLVLYDAGVDPHQDDRLGKLALTDEGLFKRDKLVLQTCMQQGYPVATVVGGGYYKDVITLAYRHLLLFKAATEQLVINKTLNSVFKEITMADRIKVHIEGKEYNVVGGGFQDMLAVVKQINGRRFMSASKAWQLPGSYVDIQNQVEISGYQLEDGRPIADETPAAQQSSARPGGDRIRVTVQGHKLAIVGGSFQDMLAVVKNLPSRRFNGDSKIWEIPGDVTVTKQLVEAAGFQLEGAEKIDLGPVPPMETPLVAPASKPPPFETPDFLADDDIPPYEAPDWWDDDDMPPPPMESPDWWDEQPPELPSTSHEPPPDFGSAPSFSSAAASSSASRGGDQIRVRVGGIPMVVSGSSFQQMLVAIKNVPGRRFDGNDKMWDIPAEVTLDGFKQQMEAAGFEVARG